MLSVLQTGDWCQLKDALLFSPSSVHLPDGLDDELLNEAFATPTALAYALLTDKPALLRQRMIRVLVLSPERSVMRHGLHTFSMLPALTNQPGSRFHVSIVGDALLRSNDIKDNCVCEEYENVTLFHQDTFQFLSENPVDGNFDLVMFILPTGNGEKKTLPCMPGFAEMQASGIPILMIGQDMLMTSRVLAEKAWAWANQVDIPILPSLQEIEHLSLAVANHDNSMVEPALTAHPYWANTFNSNGCGLIHHAVIFENEDAIFSLHQAGVDFSLRSAAGFTPLQVAIRSGAYSIADTLIALGADPEQRLPDMNTPLIDAAVRGDINAVILLLGSGANPYEEGVNGVSFDEMAPFLLLEHPEYTDQINQALSDAIESA